MSYIESTSIGSVSSIWTVVKNHNTDEIIETITTTQEKAERIMTSYTNKRRILDKEQERIDEEQMRLNIRKDMLKEKYKQLDVDYIAKVPASYYILEELSKQ